MGKIEITSKIVFETIPEFSCRKVYNGHLLETDCYPVCGESDKNPIDHYRAFAFCSSLICRPDKFYGDSFTNIEQIDCLDCKHVIFTKVKLKLFLKTFYENGEIYYYGDCGGSFFQKYIKKDNVYIFFEYNENTFEWDLKETFKSKKSFENSFHFVPPLIDEIWTNEKEMFNAHKEYFEKYRLKFVQIVSKQFKNVFNNHLLFGDNDLSNNGIKNLEDEFLSFLPKSSKVKTDKNGNVTLIIPFRKDNERSK